MRKFTQRMGCVTQYLFQSKHLERLLEGGQKAVPLNNFIVSQFLRNWGLAVILAVRGKSSLDCMEGLARREYPGDLVSEQAVQAPSKELDKRMKASGEAHQGGSGGLW